MSSIQAHLAHASNSLDKTILEAMAKEGEGLLLTCNKEE